MAADGVSSCVTTTRGRLSKIFDYSPAELKDLSDDILMESEKGLASHGHMIAMLASHITDFPTGQETGEFFALVTA